MSAKAKGQRGKPSTTGNPSSGGRTNNPSLQTCVVVGNPRSRLQGVIPGKPSGKAER